MHETLSTLQSIDFRPDNVGLSFYPPHEIALKGKMIARIPDDPNHYLRWITNDMLGLNGLNYILPGTLDALSRAIDIHSNALRDAGFKLPYPRNEAGEDIQPNHFISHAPEAEEPDESAPWALYSRVRIIEGTLINKHSPVEDIIEVTERHLRYALWTATDDNPTGIMLDDIFKEEQTAKEKGSNGYYVLDIDPYFGQVGVSNRTWEDALNELRHTASWLGRHGRRNKAREYQKRIREIKTLGRFMLRRTIEEDYQQLVWQWNSSHSEGRI